MLTQYYTATSLDGFIADADNSLGWLFTRDRDEEGPLNYGDFGFDLTGPEVHADGEIWIATQIDLRDLFLSRYPSSGTAEDIACVRGQIAASSCPGDRRWIQDYYDAMVMMPRNPTMAGARDAMLAATWAGSAV